VVLEQLEDLLDHVMGAGSPGSSSPVSIHGFVGHSTGGCVGALATNGLADYRFERLVLVSPCFWKNAPLVSVLCGKAPGLVTLVLRSGKMDFLAQGDYAKNGVIAWMREGGDGAYVYPAAEEKKRLADAAMFKSHPYVSGAIASLDLYILNLALLPSYRDMVREAVGNGSRVSVLWGEGDQTVPYNKNTLEECKGTKAETITLERLGHESIYEDGPRVAAQVLASLSRS
jgi:pimeloyl-ACP methyl ester carboxylesterase